MIKIRSAEEWQISKADYEQQEPLEIMVPVQNAFRNLSLNTRMDSTILDMKINNLLVDVRYWYALDQEYRVWRHTSPKFGEYVSQFVRNKRTRHAEQLNSRIKRIIDQLFILKLEQ